MICLLCNNDITNNNVTKPKRYLEIPTNKCYECNTFYIYSNDMKKLRISMHKYKISFSFHNGKLYAQSNSS
jgi:hypothetical protein